MQNELLSTVQLAARLGVKPQTVREWVLRGKIPEMRLSHKVRRFHLDDVLKALQTRQALQQAQPTKGEKEKD